MTESEATREHIDWLTHELMRTQKQLRQRNEILSDMLNPDVFGWVVPQEIRAQIYNLFSHEREEETNSYNRK
jgi:hypothetical protein